MEPQVKVVRDLGDFSVIHSVYVEGKEAPKFK